MNNADNDAQVLWALKAFICLQIIYLRASTPGNRAVLARMYAEENGIRYLVYESQAIPQTVRPVWIDSRSEDQYVRIYVRPSSKIFISVFGTKKSFLGQTTIPIQPLKNIAEGDDAAADAHRFGPLVLYDANKVAKGSIELHIKLDFDDSDCSRPKWLLPPDWNLVERFESLSSSFSKILRWFIAVTEISFSQPWPTRAKITWLVLSWLWRYHSSIPGGDSVVIRENIGDDMVDQMKELLFILKGFMPQDREPIGSQSLDPQQPDTLTLLRQVILELCHCSILLERIMYEHEDYSFVHADFRFLLPEFKIRQQALFALTWNVTTLAVDGHLLEGSHERESIVRDLLNRAREELRINARKPSFISALSTPRGIEAEEVFRIVFEEIQASTGPDQRKELRRIFTRAIQWVDKLPSLFWLKGVVPETHIGAGGFADVYSGECDGVAIAIKSSRILRDGMPNDSITRSQFYLEVITWTTLKHQRVLEFFGLASLPPLGELCMVSPLMLGSTIPTRFLPPPVDVDNAFRLQCIREIAEGMLYLHTEGVVHGDLRGSNVFITDDNHIKLADFGLSVFEDGCNDGYVSLHTSNARWSAPELINARRLSSRDDYDIFPELGEESVSRPTRATDVYSFACLCIEIYTGAAPYQNLVNEAAVVHFVTSSEDERPGRPFRPPNLKLDALWALIQSCWEEDPSRRPDFHAIVAEL